MGGLYSKAKSLVSGNKLVADVPHAGAHGPGDPIYRSHSPENLQDAITMLQESFPTMPGMNMFLDQHGYRSITQSIRDINDAARLSILQRGENQSIVNALGNRAMTIRTDFIVSEGFNIEPETSNPQWAERIQRVIDDHTDLNEWEDRLFDRVLDLGVTGEMIRRMPPINRKLPSGETFRLGRFKCGNIVPHLVQKVEIDPWNYESLDKVFIQEYALPNAAPTILKIVRDDRMGDDAGMITGEVFFLPVNLRPGASRGLSDLTPAMEWLDMHDSALLNDVERAAMMMRFIWDVTLENATPAQCQKFLAELKINPIRAGTVRAHNQKEIWDAIAPDLKIQDTSKLREDLFLHAWGAMGLPRHYYVEAENVNRASAEEMKTPIFAWARTRRKKIQKYLKLEYSYAIQVAWESGRLQGIPYSELGIRVVSRDPDRSAYDALGQTLVAFSQSLPGFVSTNMLPQEFAADILRTVIGSFGFELPETMPAGTPMPQAPPMPQAGLMQPNPAQVTPAVDANGLPMEAPLQAVYTEAMQVLRQNRGVLEKLKFDEPTLVLRRGGKN